MALNQTPRTARTRPTGREVLERRSIDTGLDIRNRFRDGSGGGRGKSKGPISQEPTQEDQAAIAEAAAKAESERAAAASAEAKRVAAASRAGSLAERQNIVSGRSAPTANEAGRNTLRQLSGNQFDDAVREQVERRRDNPNLKNLRDQGITTKQEYERTIVNKYIDEKSNSFNKLSAEEQDRIASDPSSGFVVQGGNVTYTPTEKQLKEAKQEATKSFQNLSIEEKGALSAAGARASAYKFPLQTIISSGDLLQDAASGGIAQSKNGKIINPGSVENAGSKTETLLRKVPGVSKVLDKPSDPATTTALVGGSLFFGAASARTKFKELVEKGFTRAQALAEVIGSLSPVQIKERSFFPDVSTAPYKNTLNEVKVGDLTFSSIRSDAPGISSETFLQTRQNPKGVSMSVGFGQTTTTGLERRGVDFIPIERKEYFTLGGLQKGIVKVPQESTANKLLQDIYRAETREFGPGGRATSTTVEMDLGKSRITTASNEKNNVVLGEVPVKPNVVKYETFETGSSSISTDLATGKRTTSDSFFPNAKRVSYINAEKSSVEQNILNPDVEESGTTILVNNGKGRRTPLSKTFGKQTQTPVAAPVIRPNQPAISSPTTGESFSAKAGITSGIIREFTTTQATDNFPSIVGGTSRKPSAFAGTGEYERTNETLAAKPGTATRDTLGSGSGSRSGYGSPQRTGFGTRSELDTSQQTGLGQSSNTAQTPRSGQVERQSQRTKLGLELLKQLALRQKQQTGRSTSRPGKGIPVIRVGIGGSGGSGGKGLDLNQAKAYDVFIRKQGKKVKIAEGLPFGKATEVGVRRNLADISASYTLEEKGTTSSRDKPSFVPSNLFRKSKSRPNTFVQVERSRLSSFGEKRDIKRSRKRRSLL